VQSVHQIFDARSAPTSPITKLILDSRYEIEIGDGFSPETLSILIYTLGRL
jgi:hypothetical protein